MASENMRRSTAPICPMFVSVTVALAVIVALWLSLYFVSAEQNPANRREGCARRRRFHLSDL